MSTTQTINEWIGNDEDLYLEVQHAAKKFVRQNTEIDENDDETIISADAVSDMVDWLKDFIDNMNPSQGGMFGDIINQALSEVDWYDLATGYIEEQM